jgi:hypothetical protein
MEDLTQEQIQSSILAAYDSVNLINELQVKETLTEEEVDTLQRNKTHISIMLEKEWFFSELTEEQVIELQNLTATF